MRLRDLTGRGQTGHSAGDGSDPPSGRPSSGVDPCVFSHATAPARSLPSMDPCGKAGGPMRIGTLVFLGTASANAVIAPCRRPAATPRSTSWPTTTRVIRRTARPRISRWPSHIYQCMITISDDETVPGSGARHAARPARRDSVRGRCRALWVKFVVVRTELTPEPSHGHCYSLTLLGPDGSMLIGFDNAYPARAGRGRTGTIGTGCGQTDSRSTRTLPGCLRTSGRKWTKRGSIP